jgi:hypothetical protein
MDRFALGGERETIHRTHQSVVRRKKRAADEREPTSHRAQNTKHPTALHQELRRGTS